MVLLNLDSLDKVEKLTKVCERYDVDVDIIYGRYTINGKSVLGVTSLIGNIVKIIPDTNDNLMLGYITRDLLEIGAWETN